MKQSMWESFFYSKQQQTDENDESEYEYNPEEDVDHYESTQ